MKKVLHIHRITELLNKAVVFTELLNNYKGDFSKSEDDLFCKSVSQTLVPNILCLKSTKYISNAQCSAPSELEQNTFKLMVISL